MQALDTYVASIAASATGCREIWLIGSRANGAERPDSDWDLLVFGDEASIAQLRAAQHLHREDVDCLVMADDTNFESAWGDKLKSGSLSKWEWHRTDETSATYTEVKWHEAEGSTGFRCQRRRALLIWSAPQLALEAGCRGEAKK